MLSASVSPPSPPLASLQGVPEQGPPVLSQLFGLPLLRATIMCWILINTRRPEKNSSRSYSWTPPHCPFPLLVMNQHPLPPEEPRPTQCIHTHIHTELERGWTLTPDICPSPFPTRLSDGLSITSGPRLGNCCLVITSHVVFFFFFFFSGSNEKRGEYCTRGHKSRLISANYSARRADNCRRVLAARMKNNCFPL